MEASVGVRRMGVRGQRFLFPRERKQTFSSVKERPSSSFSFYNKDLCHSRKKFTKFLEIAQIVT